MGTTRRIPQIRKKGATGGFFVRWGGKDRYLSTDFATAERLYLDPESTHPASLVNYRRWLATRQAPADPRARSGPDEPAAPVTVADLAARMLEEYDAQRRRADPAGYFRRHLVRWLNAAGHVPLREITRVDTRRSYLPPAIALARALADDMRALNLSPKTINHDLTAIKRLFAWGAERGLVPELPWRALRKLPTRRGEPVVWTPAAIRAQIDRALALGGDASRVGPWLAVNYLTACRPSEVVTLVNLVCGWPDTTPGAAPGSIRRRRSAPRGPGVPGLGRLVALGADGQAVPAAAQPTDPVLAELRVHKNDWRDDSGESEPLTRRLIVTPQARRWLEVCRPAWATLDGYSSAARDAGLELRPSHCRDSAASHLRHAGADLADTALVLGHAHRGEWPSYAQVPWRALAARVAGLEIGDP